MIQPRRLFADQALSGQAPTELSGIARDSRHVQPGDAFVAMSDASSARTHALQAVAAGATLVVAEEIFDTSALILKTPHARWSYARASAALHGVDRGCPPLLGVTGTKGKSTTVHCAWWALGAGAARVGTIGWHDGREERANSQTTPPPEELHRFLAQLSPGCQGVALEISSHGADQCRLAGLSLRALAYTGLGHDHLDYHGTPAAYLTAKLKTMRALEPGGRCIINADDPTAYIAIHAARAAGGVAVALGFGNRQRSHPPGPHRHRAHLDARLIRRVKGYQLIIDGASFEFHSPLPGDYNAWNAAAGALMANALGTPLEIALKRIASLPGVPGRMELLAHSPATYVDYAHTPESIASALAAVRAAHAEQDVDSQPKKPAKKVAIVFGCGGNRDRSKRAPMGRAASSADVVVITTDNSRSELPAAIAKDIVEGLPDPSAVVWNAIRSATLRSGGDVPITVVELDRASAIRLARRLVGNNGVVLVAGKGHETTQDIRGVISPWDDRAFVRTLTPEPTRKNGDAKDRER